MLQATCVGHLGGDAQVKGDAGKEFTTFRVAHSSRWTDEQGVQHDNTLWVDCVLNGKPAVIEYLKKGQMVYVSGQAETRLYSSAKDRCMKAGLKINVRTIELLGGKGDDVPSVLFSAVDGAQVDVTKWYFAASLVRDESQPEFLPLVSRNQSRFVVDRNGWVKPFVEENQQG